MKLSKYNIIKETESEILIYNLITSGVLKLNTSEHIENFKKLLNNESYDDIELDEQLKRGDMLIDKDIVEEDMLKLSNNMMRFNTNSLSLTIAPTLGCNFACPYCYEKGVQNTLMDKGIADEVVKFISKFKDAIKHLSIVWYGGEPLIALDIIEYLTKSILDMLEDKISYSASIVTNGYFLTKEVAEKLKELKIQHVQVTIDGNKEIHDNRRKLLNGNPTYDIIIKNIKESCKVIPINIRTNIDKSNANKLDELLIDYKNAGFDNNKNVQFYLAPVDDINDSCKNSNCFNMSDFSDVEVGFYNKLLDNGFYNIGIPNPCLGCGAMAGNSFIIDPKGDLYKCWDTIGHDDEKIGDIFSEVKPNKNLTKWLLYDELESEECKKCNVLPLCMGGCAYQKIKSGKNKCTPKRYNISSILKVFHRCRNLQSSMEDNNKSL